MYLSTIFLMVHYLLGRRSIAAKTVAQETIAKGFKLNNESLTFRRLLKKQNVEVYDWPKLELPRAGKLCNTKIAHCEENKKVDVP